MKVSIKAKLIILFLAIITLSLVLISWRGFEYFSRDKETYVQDLNAQNIMVLSDFLADRVMTFTKIMETFSEFVDYRFSTETERANAQKNLMTKFKDFISLSVFKVTPSFREVFSVYNTSLMDDAKITKTMLTDKKRILDIYGGLKDGEIYYGNFTHSFGLPVVQLCLRKKGGVFISASLPQKAMMDIVSKKAVYTAFVVNDKGELVMHQNPGNLLAKTDFSSNPMVREFLKDKERITLARTKEYKEPGQGKDMLGAWAHVAGTGLGLFIETPKSLAYEAAKALLEKLAIWVGLIFVVSVVVTLMFSSKITKPLQRLTDFARRVGKGDFNVDMQVTTKDEIGNLMGAFNKMGEELKIRDEKIEETHKQLVQSEKMGAFGQMSAGIAHEVKNPLAGILGYAQLAKKKAGEDASIQNYLGIIEKETKRCKDIVENLMRFARAEKSEFTDIPFYKTVRDSVALVDHQITISGIKIERKFQEGDGPLVNGNANQLTQVLTNIMLNAQYAMKKKGEGGTLAVELFPVENGKAKVTIQDTGTGIKPENIGKLFEPFFTTKPAGEGTGLGLSVSFGIIKDHKGEIRVESEYGQWTRFIIELPVKQT